MRASVRAQLLTSILLGSFAQGLDAQVASQADGARGQLQSLLRRYCTRCHRGDDPKGGVDLQSAVERDLAGVRDDARLWRRVETAVHDRSMPPRSARRQPEDGERESFAAALRSLRRAAAEAGPPDPGVAVLRRLNRTQYVRTVEDLLGVSVPGLGRLFPEDPRGHGFDTVGDVLFLSPLLIERYWEGTQLALDALAASPGGLASALADTEEASVRGLLARAFRRPARAEEVTARLGLAEQGPRAVLASALLSPEFLFRVEPERADADGAFAVSDHELAVRLSYFLWGTMPDAALRARADRGELHDDAVLEAEVHRLLDDPRARSLADEFGAQWLGYAGLRSAARDVRRFRRFEQLRGSMYEEAARSVDALFREDRPVTELIDADSTFVDAALAAHYGLPGVQGEEMRRVALPDRRRGGVLGWAAVLTATSTPLRTSPVVRGRFVLEDLLGTPPPPPPPNAGVLPEDDEQKDGLTLRERLLRHRRDPTCAACHDRIDPYGLALEAFDAVGAWRTEAQGQPVDATARLADGTEIAGIEGLKDHLLGRRDQVVRTMAERMLVYALGRPLVGADEAVLDGVVDEVREAGYRGRSLVLALVRSFPFRHRRNP